MWSNTPLNELDLTKSEKGGPSYRSLPKNFPLLSCSEVYIAHVAAKFVCHPSDLHVIGIFDLVYCFHSVLYYYKYSMSLFRVCIIPSLN